LNKASRLRIKISDFYYCPVNVRKRQKGKNDYIAAIVFEELKGHIDDRIRLYKNDMLRMRDNIFCQTLRIKNILMSLLSRFFKSDYKWNSKQAEQW